MELMDNQQPNTLNGGGSTTIPRKGSTILDRLEIADIEFISINNINIQHSYVYGIYCIENDSIYIGSTVNLKKRIQRHSYYLRNNKHHSFKLQRVCNKYGIESLFVVKIELCVENQLINREQYWIDKLNSYYNGLNCSKTALYHRTFKLTEEQINKSIIKSRKAIFCFSFDGIFIKEYVSISEAAREIKVQSTNISACCKGRLNYLKEFIFIYKEDYDENKDYSLKKREYNFSNEHKKNISNALKGQKPSNKAIESLIKRCSIPINKYDLNGNLIAKYSNYKECCENNNLYIKTLKKNILEQTPLEGFLYKFNEDIV